MTHHIAVFTRNELHLVKSILQAVVRNSHEAGQEPLELADLYEPNPSLNTIYESQADFELSSIELRIIKNVLNNKLSECTEGCRLKIVD